MLPKKLKKLTDRSEKYLATTEDFVKKAEDKIDPENKSWLDSNTHMLVSNARELKDGISDLEKELAKSRDKIAKVITYTFVSLLFVAFLYVIVISFYDPQLWQFGMEYIRTMITSVVLPVVTLVLGYYFGSRTIDGGS